MNAWFTTDKTNCLNMWDIEKEEKAAVISSPKIRSNILDLVELEILKLVAISSLDKSVTIWDLHRQVIIMELDLSQSGVHTVKWSTDYQILITVGFENDISLWSIHPDYLDISSSGKLIGHPSLVTAVEAIEKTPMIVSSDDLGNIRVWDIRNLKCIQIISLGIKIPINSLIDTYKYGKLYFIGSRINYIEFDDNVDIMNRIKSEEQLWPTYADYNFNTDEIIVCTRRDIRFLDIKTGRTKKIYAGLLSNDEDEIASFRLLHQNKKFILGSERGQVNLYSYATGELIKKLASHTNEVANVKIDYTNNIIVTGGWDSCLYIQKENQLGFELKRSIKNMHYKKEVILMELSVYHNLIVTTTNNHMLYVWDYEYVKLIASIEIASDLEPTFIQFVNGYSFIIIGDSNGKVNLIHFKRRDVSLITFQRVALIDLAISFGSKSKSTQEFATKAAVESKYLQKSEKIEVCKLYLSTNRGTVISYDISHLFSLKICQLVPHSNTKVNYNADRVVHENFLAFVSNYKIPNFKIPNDQSESKDCPLILLNQNKITEFQAHREPLTTLSVLDGPEKRLLTCALDSYVKVWTHDGRLLGSLNINHPLPVKWDLGLNNVSLHRKKILYALKVVESIFKRYKNSVFVTEANNIAVNGFIKDLNTASPQISPSFVTQDVNEYSGSISTRQRAKERVMMDAYSTRDLQFEKAKIVFERELQGPSLRQMDITKRITQDPKIPKLLNTKEVDPDEKIQFEATRKVEMDKDRHEFMTFLLEENKRGFLIESNLSERTQSLATKLESISHRTKRDRERDSPRGNTNVSLKHSNTIHFHSSSGQKNNPATSSAMSGQPTINSNNDYFNDGDHRPSKVVASRPNFTDKNGNETVKLRKKGVILLNSPVSKLQLDQINTSYKSPTANLQSMRSKSNTKTDFFKYANEKLNPTEDAFASTGRESTSQILTKAVEFERRIKRQNFSKIMTKLSDNLRKSHGAGFNMKPIKIPGLILDSNFASPNSTQIQSQAPTTRQNDAAESHNEKSNSANNKLKSTIPPLDILEHRRNSSLPPFENIKSSYNFLEDLKSVKKTVEEVWGLKMEGSMSARNQLGLTRRVTDRELRQTRTGSFSNGGESPKKRSFVARDNLAFMSSKAEFPKGVSDETGPLRNPLNRYLD